MVLVVVSVAIVCCVISDAFVLVVRNVVVIHSLVGLGEGGGMPVLDARWKVGEVTVLAVISQHGSLNSPKIREFASFALPVRKSIWA